MTLASTIFDPVAQFGVAGLMGVLWVWERMNGRKRDRQIAEAHTKLMRSQDALRLLTRLVRRNTQAIERFAATQSRLCELLDRVREELRQRA